jgi:hypothetical protein
VAKLGGAGGNRSATAAMGDGLTSTTSRVEVKGWGTK